jgi:hypothetical protein
MTVVRFDPHAHLYDCYPLKEWCEAAHRNLRGEDGVCAVIIVDRAGQDSFARFQREAASFGAWREASPEGEDRVSEAGVVEWSDKSLIVIRGVQYVSVERIEVLALGAARSVPDGAPAGELVDLVRREGGVPCLPWSPGKWIGARGRVVQKIMKETSPRALVFGDIAIRTNFGPLSLLLRRARRSRFLVACGTDPLPIAEDLKLVGSFGMQVQVDISPTVDTIFSGVIQPALLGDISCARWGQRNGVWRALRRFVTCASKARTQYPVS